MKFKKGDKFNIILNDGSLKQLYRQQTQWTTETQNIVTEFVNNNIRNEYTSTALLSPVEFMKSSLSASSNEKQLDLILIDQTNSYQYNMDTSKIDSATNLLFSKLPENTTVFGLIGYNWNNPVARIQNALIQRKNGMSFYSWGDQNEIFGSIGRTLTPRVFPASVTFTCGQNAFVYDVNGPADDRIFYGLPVTYTGKIRGNTDTFNIHFTYDLNGTISQKKSSFPVHFTTSAFDPVEKIWAAARVEKLTYKSSSYAYNEYSDALNVSLKYRILTNQTALIAFEPGLMTENWYSDDQTKGTAAGQGTTSTNQINRYTYVQPTLNVFVKTGLFRITLDGIDGITKNTTFSLKLYDLKGRLIYDLTKNMLNVKKKVDLEMKTAGLTSGIYILKFTMGKTVLQRTVTVR